MGDWKLIHNGHVGANVVAGDRTETWELFHLRDDPSEVRNVSKKHPDVVERLRKKLAALADEAGRPNIPPNRPPKGFESPKTWGHSDNAETP